MATVMARQAETPVGRGRPGVGKLSGPPLTLADLITAVQDVVGPGDDRLVVATVRHLLGAGLLIVLGTGTRRCPPQPQETGWSRMVTGGARHPSAVARRWRCGRNPGGRGHRGEPPGTQPLDHRQGGEESWKGFCCVPDQSRCS
jgi:hypothetical protein